MLYIRLDDIYKASPFSDYWHLYVLFLPSTLILLWLLGINRVALRFSNWELSKKILQATAIGTVSATFILYFIDVMRPPRSCVILFPFTSTLLLYSSRTLLRFWLIGSYDKALFFQGANRLGKPRRRSRPAAIFGAGVAGQQLAQSLKRSKSVSPVIFFDDNWALHDSVIQGMNVFHSSKIEAKVKKYNIEEILLAIPSCSRAQLREIVERIEAYNISIRRVPSLEELASGNLSISSLKPVEIKDILGRNFVTADETLMRPYIENKVIMVTGSGGSIGLELCLQLIVHKPAKLILFEHAEFNLYRAHQRLASLNKEKQLAVELTLELGSVTNPDALMQTLKRHSVDLLYHAAAYKHVPLVEANPLAGFINNCMGTLYCAQACLLMQVPQLVLISSDKAVRPTSIMGATKRLSELILQALSDEKQVQLSQEFGLTEPLANRSRFTIVRFGNVLDSSGSVIPLFRQQIRVGGPVTVTHPEINRFFMTLTEAAQLVMQASNLSTGGDVFLLDMGDPVSIDQLARKMITLSGRSIKSADNPDGDIEIGYIGLREGEKLTEELLIGDDAIQTSHAQIWRANEMKMSWSELTELLQLLDEALKKHDLNEVRRLLYRPEIEYSHKHG